jgi:hypothetical protein
MEKTLDWLGCKWIRLLKVWLIKGDGIQGRRGAGGYLGVMKGLLTLFKAPIK